jgi:hypothetical protein
MLPCTYRLCCIGINALVSAGCKIKHCDGVNTPSRGQITDADGQVTFTGGFRSDLETDIEFTAAGTDLGFTVAFPDCP